MNNNITVQEAWNVGMRRVKRIIEEEESQGYRAYATGQYVEIADIFVIDPNPNTPLGGSHDHIIKVYEVTNYGLPQFYIQKRRAEEYRDHLLQFKAQKIFVCSFEENLRYLEGGRRFFEDHGIEVRVMGSQD